MRRNQRDLTPFVPWRCRSDLIIRREGSGSWVVKDPLSLRYSLMTDPELCILYLLDGSRSFQQVCRILRRRFPSESPEIEEIRDFVAQLIQNQLVVPARQRATFQRTGQRSKSLWSVPGQVLRGINRTLRIQIPLLNPTGYLSMADPLIQKLFSRRTALVLAVLWGTAALMAGLRFEQLVRQLPGPWDFFGPDNLLLLLTTFVVIKLMHETGHAFAARRYGAECNEAGVMLLFLTPILYTNVTDAWMLNRQQRVFITAAGMVVEISLAAIATIFWFFAAPGMIKSLLANVMVIGTVGTVLFNGNPLLRYDGYFLLTDLAGRPNLANRAADRVQIFLESLLLGFTSPAERRPDHDDWFLLTWGILSSAYRIVLTVAILIMLCGLFDRWNLHIAGVLLAWAVGISMVVVPFTMFLAGMVAEAAGHSDGLRRLARASLIVMVLVSTLFIPLPQSITLPAVAEPVGVPVYATLPGTLESAMEYGYPVDDGVTIATLKSLSLQQDELQIAGEVHRSEVLVQTLERLASNGGADRIPEATAALQAARDRQSRFQRELARLTIVSPTGGVLLPPRKSGEENPADDDSLISWSGWPLGSRNLGCALEEGTLLGFVGDPRDVEVLITLTQNERRLVEKGQRAVFQFHGAPGVILEGRVQRMAELDVREIPEELTAAGLSPPVMAETHYSPGNGASSVHSDRRRWQAIVKCTFREGAPMAIWYSPGQVRVELEPASAAFRIRRFFQQSFSPTP